MASVAMNIGDVGAGAPGDGGEGLGGSDLSGILGEAWDAAQGGVEDIPGGDQGGGSSPPFEVPGETPGGESVAAAQQIQEAQPGQQQPTDSPWPLSPDGNSYQVPKAELPRVQAAMQYQQQVGQIFATPAEAQAASQQAFDFRTMYNDFQYGSDACIKGILEFFSGTSQSHNPQSRAAFGRSFEKMLTMAPGVLQQTNPQAYQGFLQATGNALVESLYQKAAQTGSKDDLLAAQGMEWALSPTGEFRKELPKADPQAQARSDFERQRDAFQKNQEAAFTREASNFDNQVVGSVNRALDGQIDKVLARVKQHYPEVAYNDLKLGIRSEVFSTLQKQDQFFEHRQHLDQLKADFSTAWHSGQFPPAFQNRVPAHVQEFMSLANRVLPSIAAKRVNASTQARAGKQNDRQGAPQQQRGAGRPSPKPQAPNGNGQKRLTDDEWNAQLAAAFRV